MKICSLVLGNFGKFLNKKITLSEGINLLYGENESGKSTIHMFIRAMLFGMERGRGRAALNDTFSMYEPWENPNFYSGKMKIEAGEKHFFIERNFDKYTKKTTIVCEEDGEELSAEDGDLEMLLNGLTPSVYDNTVSIAQLKAAPGGSLAAELENYANSYYASGDDSLDIDAAVSMLKGQKKEVEKAAQACMSEKKAQRDRLEQEASYIWRDIHRITEEQTKLKEEIADRREREKEVNGENPEQKQRVIYEIRPVKWRIHPLEILVFVLVLVGAFAVIPRPWNFLVTIVLFLSFFIYVWNRLKVGKKQEKTEPERILEEITPTEEKISLERLIWAWERGEEERKDKQVQYENIREELMELDELSDAYIEYDRQKAAIQMAVDRIQTLSEHLQKKLRVDLNARASEIVRDITGGKYNRLVIEEGLMPYLLSEGRRISIWQVSRGTACQVYFALRMAVGELMCEEELPVILDDTFAYYDDVRLEQTLEWLYRNKRQVLLFTCQKREEEALKRLGIPYGKTELSD